MSMLPLINERAIDFYNWSNNKIDQGAQTPQRMGMSVMQIVSKTSHAEFFIGSCAFLVAMPYS